MHAYWGYMSKLNGENTRTLSSENGCDPCMHEQGSPEVSWRVERSFYGFDAESCGRTDGKRKGALSHE